MDLLNISETLTIYCPVPLLALAISFGGNTWIDYLYPKALQGDSLSFPEQIPQRAKWRKLFLFISLCFCFAKAWSVLSMPSLFYIIVAISLLLFITVTDFEQQVILNEILFAFALFGLCYTLHLHLSPPDHLLAALGGGLFFLFLSIVGKGAIGGGDIKLIAALGLWLGVKPLLSVILYGATAGGIAALLLLFTKKVTRKQFFAYGPYFALSGIGVLLSWLRVLF